MNESQKKIKACEAAIARIENQAAQQNRGLLDVEKQLVDDLQEELTGLYATTPASSLVMGNGPRNAGRATHSGFESVGSFFQAVARAGSPGGQVDPRLFNATGLGETVPSEGGFLVGSDLSSALMQAIFETGLLSSRCNRLQVSGNSNTLELPAPNETSRVTGSRWGGTRGYWVDEASEITASKPTFRKVVLSLKKLTGLVYCSSELLQDALLLEKIVMQSLQDEFGFLVDDAIINGTGAGQPLGIMNAGCLVSVAKETGQAANTVVLENLVKMYSRLLPRSLKTACWLVHPSVLPQLYTMSLSVGTGGSAVYLPSGGAAGKPYASLMGMPVIVTEQCQALGTAGDIILADLQNGYLLAEKGGIRSDVSIHVRFVYDESVFRAVLRIDGCPVLQSAITPYKGSDTLSHFVALATRA